MIKMFQMFAIGVLIFIGSVGKVCAADSVGLNAMVVERKSFDTINDFNFPHVNIANAVENSNTKGSVKGVSTSAVDNLKNDSLAAGFFALILFGLLFVVYKKIKKFNKFHSNNQISIDTTELDQNSI